MYKFFSIVFLFLTIGSFGQNLKRYDSTLKIGFNNGGVGISGQVSRANFYKKDLTDREIQKNYWNYKSRYGI